jgi:hypothetical protein
MSRQTEEQRRLDARRDLLMRIRWLQDAYAGRELNSDEWWESWRVTTWIYQKRIGRPSYARMSP